MFSLFKLIQWGWYRCWISISIVSVWSAASVVQARQFCGQHTVHHLKTPEASTSSAAPYLQIPLKHARQFDRTDHSAWNLYSINMPTRPESWEIMHKYLTNKMLLETAGLDSNCSACHDQGHLAFSGKTSKRKWIKHNEKLLVQINE